MNIEQCLAEKGFPGIRKIEPVGGGSICEASRLYFDDGGTAFLKRKLQAPDSFFHDEARGLDFLREHCELTVPKVLAVTATFLLLEDLGSSPPGSAYWRDLARGLAQLHSSEKPFFGLEFDNYCGINKQGNEPNAEGFDFFAAQRILRPAGNAYDGQLIAEGDLRDLESIAQRLAELLPHMPAVAIHGDLWSGNVHCTESTKPALIDPAVHWGWAEADLAMTSLFGGFPAIFYETYEETAGIGPDWRERAAVYNLYHVLNHVLIFGGGYLGQLRGLVREVLAR